MLEGIKEIQTNLAKRKEIKAFVAKIRKEAIIVFLDWVVK